MKSIYTLAFLLLTFISTAQNEKSSKTLEVVGTAKISITPDVGVLNINVNQIDSLFSSAINGLNRKSKNITDQLKEIGFEQSAIKTRDFDVEKNQVYRNNQRIDSGYVARQQIQLEFKNNKDNITKILTQFSNSSTAFNLNFGFKLSETLREKVQEQIIELATRDAFRKAKILSDASGIEIGEVRTINYGYMANGAMQLFKNDNALYEVVLRGSNTISEGFTPSDKTYTDNVLVIWNLK